MIKKTFLLGLFLMASASMPAFSDDDATDPVSGVALDTPYSFFQGYFWAMGIDGKASINNNGANFNSSFGDQVDGVTNAMTGRFEHQFGLTGFNVDVLWANRWNEAQMNINQTLTLNTNLTVVDLTGDIRLLGYLGDITKPKKVKFDLTGGARTIFNSSYISEDPGDSKDLSKTWIEPVVGARLYWTLSRTLMFEGWGDVGGFGLSSTENWSSNVVGTVNWFIDDSVALTAGYRAFYLQNHYSSGANSADVETTLSGPMLGVVFFLN